MQRQTEYKVVTAGDLSVDQAMKKLEQRVNDLLAHGWTVQGGVTASDDVMSVSGEQKRFYVFFQAMVKQ